MSLALIYGLAALAASYVLGSIPTGLWLGQALRGVDIRAHGSKNIGATNTLRVLGKKLGALALSGDMAKGLVPVLLFSRLAPWPHLPLACGVAAILGHSFSIFLGFHGGKGVATSTGVFLGLAPLATLMAAGVFGAVVYTTRMVSAGSIAAAFALSIGVCFFPLSFPIRVATWLIALLVVYKHRSNIGRILKGNENKF